MQHRTFSHPKKVEETSSIPTNNLNYLRFEFGLKNIRVSHFHRSMVCLCLFASGDFSLVFLPYSSDLS